MAVSTAIRLAFYTAGQRESLIQKAYKLQRVFLVTNRHVFQGANDRNAKLIARLNATNGSGSATYPVNPVDDHWTVHRDPKVDVAVLSINPLRLADGGIGYQTVHRVNHTFTRRQLSGEEIGEGDGIFEYGLSLSGLQETNGTICIVRQGVIASIQNWLDGGDKTFLIDATIYPGNSVGPVFTKPEVAVMKCTAANNSCSRIGVVPGFLTLHSRSCQPCKLTERTVNV